MKDFQDSSKKLLAELALLSTAATAKIGYNFKNLLPLSNHGFQDLVFLSDPEMVFEVTQKLCLEVTLEPLAKSINQHNSDKDKNEI